jgi:hypothetical protein
MTNGGGLVIPMMATALLATRISALFTPPLYEALAQKNYFPKVAASTHAGQDQPSATPPNNPGA